MEFLKAIGDKATEKDIAIAITAAVLGSLLTWLLDRWNRLKERKKQTVQSVFDTCQRLRELLGDWFSDVQEATKDQKSAAAAVQNLENFSSRVHFDTRIDNLLLLLEPEPLCQDLIKCVVDLRKSAREQQNAVVEMARTFDSEHSFSDYKHARDNALQLFKDSFGPAQRELDRISPVLQQRMM